jgi:hypothetical protein
MFFRFALYGFLKNLRFYDPFIILIFREVGLSFLEIGLLYTIREIAINILEIPTGMMADAFGRRKAMVMAFVSYIVSFVIFYSFSDFGMYAIAMVCFAFGEAFRSGTHKALILEHLRINGMEDQKVSYYGRTRAASQFGSAINSLIAAALVFFTGDYRYMFLAAILPYALNLVNLITYPKALDGSLTQLRWENLGEQMKQTLVGFRAIFKNLYAMKSILNSAGFTAFFKTTKDYVQPIIQTFALSLPILITLQDDKRAAIVIGFVFFILYLLSSYSSRSAAAFSKKFKSMTTAINSTFLAGAVLLLIAGWASWQQLSLLSILVFVGLHIGQNLRKPLNVANISDQIERKMMASGLSIESQTVTLLTAILAPLLGGLADALGIGAALAVLGVLMLAMAMFAQVKGQSSNQV